MNRKIFILMIIFLFCLSSKMFAQQKQPSQNLLNDIEIMEAILGKMLCPTTPNVFLSGSNSSGIYLVDYGVIFIVPYSFSTDKVISVNFEQLLQRYEMQAVTIGDEQEKETKSNIKEELNALKKSISRFMGVYASSIRELLPTERVIVIVNFDGFMGRFRRSAEKLPTQLLCSASMKNLKNFRQGKISEQAFENKLDFKELNSIAEDISIFGNVIKTSLEHSRDIGTFNLSDDVKGFFLGGHGVLFIADVNWSFGGVQELFFGGNNNTSLTYSIFDPNNKKSIEDTDKKVKSLERKLIQSISNYGHTLSLNSDDWVELVVNFNSTLPGKNYSKTIIKVKKKSIDDFNRDKINFEQFQNKVQVTYY